jgi:hypothetical protein
MLGIAFVLNVGFPGYFIVLLAADSAPGDIIYTLCMEVSVCFWLGLYSTKFGYIIIDKYIKTAFRHVGGIVD